MQGNLKYTSEVSLSNNVGNIRRIENLADIQINQKIQQFSESLEKAKTDLEEAKSNVSKPFERARELEAMQKRLDFVNSELSKGNTDISGSDPVSKGAEPVKASSIIVMPAISTAERIKTNIVRQSDKPPSPQLEKKKKIMRR